MRRAERGETVTVTVSGREVAQLGPLHKTEWRTWVDVKTAFAGATDDTWTDDRDLIDHTVADPFAR